MSTSPACGRCQTPRARTPCGWTTGRTASPPLSTRSGTTTSSRPPARRGHAHAVRRAPRAARQPGRCLAPGANLNKRHPRGLPRARSRFYAGGLRRLPDPRAVLLTAQRRPRALLASAIVCVCAGVGAVLGAVLQRVRLQVYAVAAQDDRAADAVCEPRALPGHGGASDAGGYRPLRDPQQARRPLPRLRHDLGAQPNLLCKPQAPRCPTPLPICPGSPLTPSRPRSLGARLESPRTCILHAPARAPPSQPHARCRARALARCGTSACAAARGARARRRCLCPPTQALRVPCGYLFGAVPAFLRRRRANRAPRTPLLKC